LNSEGEFVMNTSASVVVAGRRWRQVNSFLASGPSDRHFMASSDDDGGIRLRFGDGVHGARLATGQSIVSAVYRSGAGATGNATTANDISIAILDTFAAIADVLAQNQDAIAAEGYLETDRARVSARDEAAVQEALRGHERHHRICLCFYPGRIPGSRIGDSRSGDAD
jgi:hypothetical protein